MDAGTAAEVVALLAQRGLSLAVAESLTGGGVGQAITAVPGSSGVFLGAVVAYDTGVKASVLGVSPALLEEHGAVSAACAEAMAARARQLFGADLALSTTGVAGPDPQEGHPPGTAFVAVAGPGPTRVRRLQLTGDRAGVRAAVVEEALTEVLRTAFEVKGRQRHAD